MIIAKIIKPLFTTIITTADTYDNDEYGENGILVYTKGTTKEFQKVVAIGDNVRGIKVDDVVKVNPIRYGIPKHNINSIKNDGSVKGYDIPVIEINGKKHLKLEQADIDYILEDFDEVHYEPMKSKTYND